MYMYNMRSFYHCLQENVLLKRQIEESTVAGAHSEAAEGQQQHVHVHVHIHVNVHVYVCVHIMDDTVVF